MFKIFSNSSSSLMSVDFALVGKRLEPRRGYQWLTFDECLLCVRHLFSMLCVLIFFYYHIDSLTVDTINSSL